MEGGRECERRGGLRPALDGQGRLTDTVPSEQRPDGSGSARRLLSGGGDF